MKAKTRTQKCAESCSHMRSCAGKKYLVLSLSLAKRRWICISRLGELRFFLGFIFDLRFDNLKRTHGLEYLALNCQASEWFSIIYQSPSSQIYISMLISALLMGTKQYPPLLPFNRIKYNITLLVLIYALNHIASKMSKSSIDVSREASAW